MPFVLDASAVLPWCFRDEATPATDALLAAAVSGESVFVPAHWGTEVLGGLTRAARRGRLDDDALDQFLKFIPELSIEVDDRPMAEQWAEALPLIRLYQLSAYDAAYLALAMRLKVPLATFDDKLRTAAAVEQVALAL